MLATMLAGCGKTSSKEKNHADRMGRYVENTLTSLEGINRVPGVFRDANGIIVFYAVKSDGAKSSITRNVISKDGKVESTDVGGLNEIISDGGSVNDISEGADGVVYALIAHGIAGAKLARSMDGKAFETIEVSGWDTNNGPAGNPSSGCGTGLMNRRSRHRHRYWHLFPFGRK